ncbi:MAG TPA: ArsC family reductase [Hyphomicrobiales bacterium]|nr:ArsC family reductase [Hyphomicrobiales bacterium]
MPLTLYGIPNCDTVKKARTWLEAKGTAYTFHDYKKAGIDAASLKRWMGVVGKDTLLNTHGTTWRKLDEAERSNLSDARAIALMQAHPSVIKRPVLEGKDILLVGFNAEQWESLL